MTSNEAAISATLTGFGIARLLSYQVASEVESGRLQLLLPEFDPAPYPVHILHREGRHASVKVRAFIDLLAERLRADGRVAG